MFQDSQKLLVWSMGDSAGAVGEIDLATGRFRDSGITFDGPLSAVSAQDGLLCTLQKSGVVRVFRGDTGTQMFVSSWPGAVCLAPLGAGSLAVGRLAGGRWEARWSASTFEPEKPHRCQDLKPSRLPWRLTPRVAPCTRWE